MGSRLGGDVTQIPVILCDGWFDAQVKAFRSMVNRPVIRADWDESLLSPELQELKAEDFDLSLTGSIKQRSTIEKQRTKRERDA